MGVILAIEKELGTATWRRKGLLPAIVCRSPAARCPLPGVVSHRSPTGSGHRGSGGRQPRATIAGNNPFLLHFAVQSVGLNIDVDVEVEEPEASGVKTLCELRKVL